MGPPCLTRLVMMATWTLLIVLASASDPSLVQSEDIDPRSSTTGGASRVLEGKGVNAGGDEGIVLTDGNVFQRTGCPQLITEEEAIERANDAAIPGNVIHLINGGPGRAGNHVLVLSAYFAMGYCCRSKVLQLPREDTRFPSYLSGDGKFVSDNRFFDFSGVDIMPLEEYEGLSQNPEVCEPEYTAEGMHALFLTDIHPDLMSCMNRVYLRGCEAKYLEPLIGGADFCEKPPASDRRFLGERDEQEEPGTAPRFPASEERKQADHAKAVLNSRKGLGGGGRSGVSDQGSHPGMANRNLRDPDTKFGLGAQGSAGSLVIHVRSGDIFMPINAERMKPSFFAYGQPPLQFYLWVIASQPWSDVSIVTFAAGPGQTNPTVAALEMMQRTGMLGPNVEVHKHRDLMTDIRAMLCADGLAISRSSLHFLTFGHSRAKHYFVPSECGPGTYKRSTREKNDGTPKPNPNNTTLLCMEKPESEVYGVVWEENEEAYGLYNGWADTDRQLLDMVLFDGVTGLGRCCDQ